MREKDFEFSKDAYSDSDFRLQDICRDGHPVPGRMCAASRMVARDQLEKIAARWLAWNDIWVVIE